MKWFMSAVCALCIGCGWTEARQHLPATNINVNDVERTYHLFVPSEPPDGPMPLLIAAHGGGGAGFLFPQQSQFEALAQSEGLLIALPQGKMFPGNEGDWLLNTSPDRMQDMNFIRALIDDVARNHNVDASRIYGIGYSLGSMFSYEFACQLSDKLAAITSFAGTMPVNPTVCQPERFAPIMHIHGTDDTIISYDQEWNWKSWPQVGTMRDIPSLLQYWREKYQCSEERQSDGSGSTHFVYEGCAQSAKVEHHRINGGGHGWPDEINGVSTHLVMWNFLNQFSLTQTPATPDSQE